jgi:hypothetical protein
MKRLREWALAQWNSYKYRFVPWIAFNINEKTARSVLSDNDLVSASQLTHNLELLLSQLVQYSSLRDNLDLFNSLHLQNQTRLKDTWGFTVIRWVYR